MSDVEDSSESSHGEIEDADSIVLDSSTSSDDSKEANSSSEDDSGEIESGLLDLPVSRLDSSSLQALINIPSDDDSDAESTHSDYSFEFTNENCDERINEFVSITSTNSALAMSFLQDHRWNVARSVADFAVKLKLEQDREKRAKDSSSEDEEEDECNIIPTKKLKTDTPPSTSTAASTSKSVIEEVAQDEPLTGKFFRLVTWNIDGMQPKNLAVRMKGISKILVQEKVSIAFLQEVTFDCEEILEQELSSKFHFFTGFNCVTDYFTLTLVSKGSFFKVVDHKVLDYENTFMGRNLLQVTVSDGKREYVLLNSHLESTKEGAEFRLEQFKFLLDYFKKLPKEATIFAGGDFNLRDSEVAAVGGLPSDVYDAWYKTGKRKECEFTWDTLRNDTLIIQTKWKPRCRFDRIYVRPASPLAADIVHFGLIGIQRLTPCVCYPSDHWGVSTSYRFE